MWIQFNRKFAALLSLALLMPTLAYLVKDTYKMAIITKESIAESVDTLIALRNL